MGGVIPPKWRIPSVCAWYRSSVRETCGDGGSNV
jgi:hypothetical protein